jgi:hypothetical protein
MAKGRKGIEPVFNNGDVVPFGFNYGDGLFQVNLLILK